jgi:hypothetical protein
MSILSFVIRRNSENGFHFIKVLDTTTLKMNYVTLVPDANMDMYFVYTFLAMVGVLSATLTYIIAFDKDVPEENTLRKHVVELTKKVEELQAAINDSDETDSDESEDEAVAVFRFMDDSSFYILDDDDEIVLVSPTAVPKRIVDLKCILVHPSTRLHPGGGVTLYVHDIDDDLCKLKITNFCDEFERDMFKKFIEETLL